MTDDKDREAERSKPAPATGEAHIPAKLRQRYVLLGTIGRGGMGTVYCARDLRLERRVALEEIRAGRSASMHLKARLEREVRALARIEHPNVVRVYAFEEEGDDRFIVMELLEGLTLHHRLTRGTMPPREAATMGAQIASGLQAVHDAGVIHRDVKVQNVFVTKSDEYKLMDFGLAQFDETCDGTKLTATNEILGTLYYVPPEAFATTEVDARGDIYQLGLVLYAALTGEHPFEGRLLAPKAKGNPFGPLDPPSTQNPTVDPGLDAIVMAAVATDPAARPQSARAFERLLQAYLNGHALAPFLPSTSAPSTKRNASGLTMAILLLIAVAVACLWFVSPAVDGPPRTAVSPLPPRPPRPTAKHRDRPPTVLVKTLTEPDFDDHRSQAQKALAVNNALALDGALRRMEEGRLTAAQADVYAALRTAHALMTDDMRRAVAFAGRIDQPRAITVQVVPDGRRRLSLVAFFGQARDLSADDLARTGAALVAVTAPPRQRVLFSMALAMDFLSPFVRTCEPKEKGSLVDGLLQILDLRKRDRIKQCLGRFLYRRHFFGFLDGVVRHHGFHGGRYADVATLVRFLGDQDRIIWHKGLYRRFTKRTTIGWARTAASMADAPAEAVADLFTEVIFLCLRLERVQAKGLPETEALLASTPSGLPAQALRKAHHFIDGVRFMRIGLKRLRKDGSNVRRVEADLELGRRRLRAYLFHAGRNGRFGGEARFALGDLLCRSAAMARRQSPRRILLDTKARPRPPFLPRDDAMLAEGLSFLTAVSKDGASERLRRLAVFHRSWWLRFTEGRQNEARTAYEALMKREGKAPRYWSFFKSFAPCFGLPSD